MSDILSSKVMTDTERVFYETNGYLKIPGALSQAELTTVRAAADGAERKWRADPSLPGMRGPDREDINGFIEYDDVLLNMLWHPPVLSRIREVLGNDLRMLDNDYFMNIPERPAEVRWHHDVNLPGIYHPRSVLMVKAFYFLSDVDEYCSPTLVVPGSHRFPMEWVFPKVEQAEDMPGAVAFTGKAGDAYIFNGRMYHSSSPHRGGPRRKMLIVNYGHFWMRVFRGYEPSEAAKAKANCEIKRQILGISDRDPYMSRTGVPADATVEELLAQVDPPAREPGANVYPRDYAVRRAGVMGMRE